MDRCQKLPDMSLADAWPRCCAAAATALLAWPAAPPAAAAPLPCPAPLVAQIDGLYRWQVAQRDVPGPIDLSSQSSRFTPTLERQLRTAFSLTPDDGRFVDFDVFSGTQVGTFGARVLSCAAAEGGDIEALVSVQVGLRNRPAEAPVQLRYRMRPGPGGAWQIADIHYPGDPGFRLSSYLAELLEPPRNGNRRR